MTIEEFNRTFGGGKVAEEAVQPSVEFKRPKTIAELNAIYSGTKIPAKEVVTPEKEPMVSAFGMRGVAPGEGTAGTLRVVTPKVNVKGALSPAGEAFNVVSQSAETFTNRLIDLYDFATYEYAGTKTDKLRFAGKAISFLGATAGLAFTPISAELAAAEQIPVLKWAAKPVSWMFGQLGKGGEWLSGKFIDQMNISQETKDILKAPIQELAATAAQLAFAKVTGPAAERLKGKTELKTKTVTTPDGETFQFIGSQPTRVARAAGVVGKVQAFAFAPISRSAQLITGAIVSGYNKARKAGRDVSRPEEAARIANEAVKGTEAEVPGVMSIKKADEKGKIDEAKTIRVHTNQKLVLQNFLKGREDVDYRTVGELGSDTAGNPITARFEWDYKKQKATIYVTNKSTAGDIAHELGHYFDRTMSSKIGSRLSEIVPNYAGNKAEVDGALAAYALDKLGGNASKRQIDTAVGRFVEDFRPQVERLAPAEARRFNDKFAEAVKEVILRPNEALTRAPDFTAFVRHSLGKTGIFADKMKSIKSVTKRRAEEKKLREKPVVAKKAKEKLVLAEKPTAKFIEEKPKEKVEAIEIPARETKAEKEVAIPKELESLAVEARKYKSAEEFVRANIVFRGEDFGFDLGTDKGGRFFSKSREFAQEFAGTKPLTEVGIPESLIFRPKTLPDATKDFSKAIHEAKDKGFKALFVSEGKPFGKPIESIFVFDKSAILTKSQLTDFYNQATKGIKVKEVKAKPKEVPPFAGKPITTKAFNEAKINAPEDVVNVLKDVASKNKQFSEERRSATLDEMKAFSKQFLGDENLYKNVPSAIRENIGRMKAAEQTMVDMATDLRESLKETDMSVATDAQVVILRDKLLRLEQVAEAFAGARTESSHLFSSLRGDVSAGENQIMRNLFGEMKKAGLDTGKIEEFFKDKEAIKKDTLKETKGEAFVGVWYSFLLSGPTTFIKNIVSTAGSVASEVISLAVRKPADVPISIARLWDGIKDGWGIAKEVAAGKRPGSAELAKFTREIHGKKIPYEFTGRVAWLNKLRVVGRLLAASDTVFNEGLRQMELANLKTDMPKPAEIRKLAEFHAKKEGYRGSELATKTEEYVKNPETILGDLANDFALKGTYNNDPVGVLGAISKGLSHITREKPVGKFVVPFTRIVANVISRGVDYTPYGFTRVRTGEGIFGGFLSGKLGGKVVEPMTSRQQRQQLARAAVGTLFMGVAAALAADDRLSGNGPANYSKRNQLMDAGWRPNAIKIGDTWVPYINLGPLALPLAIVGNAHDAMKYGKMSEESMSQRAAGAVAGSVGTVFEMSFLTGASDFMSIVASGDAGQLLNYVSRGLTGIVEPNLIKQVARWFDSTVYSPENVWGRIMTDMRVAGLAGVKPKLNVFGEEVRADKFPSLGPVKESDDPVVRFLADNQLWVSVPGKSTQVKIGPKESRPMTSDEYYRYIEESGPAIKEKIEAKIPFIERQATKDKKQSMIDDIVRSERERVKNAIERDARKQT